MTPSTPEWYRDTECRGRSFLLKAAQLSAAFLFLTLMFCCHSLKSSAEYRVVVATDPHYIAPSLTDGGEYFQRVLDTGDSKFMPYSEEIMDAFLEEVTDLKPDALLLTGDLTFNGAVMSHEALAEKLRMPEEAGIPVLVLTGNHDVFNVNAARYLEDSFTRVPFATSETFEELYADFGLREAASVDPDSLSYLYRLSDRVWVLMLDFNTIHDFCGVSEASFEWIERQLQAAAEAGAEVLAAGHQNLFQHTVFRGGYVIEGADRLAELLQNYGVRLFLSGHLHVQHILTEKGLTEIAGSALCSYPCQYGLLTEEDGSLHYETKQLDMKAWAERNGRSEEVFQDFQNSAAAYMTAHFKAAPPVGAEHDRAQECVHWLQQLNLAYFAGDLRGTSGLDPDGTLSKAWLGVGDLTSFYVSSLLEAQESDFIHWENSSAPK